MSLLGRSLFPTLKTICCVRGHSFFISEYRKCRP
uniref:Uncharacterized protein n=1 Tax=Heterorhabditis bacteriophora TaxID=37862 RepID=A0A1I7WFH3_HETBA